MDIHRFGATGCANADEAQPVLGRIALGLSGVCGELIRQLRDELAQGDAAARGLGFGAGWTASGSSKETVIVVSSAGTRSDTRQTPCGSCLQLRTIPSLT